MNVLVFKAASFYLSFVSPTTGSHSFFLSGREPNVCLRLHAAADPETFLMVMDGGVFVAIFCQL